MNPRIMIVALVLAGAVAGTAWWVLRSDDAADAKAEIADAPTGVPTRRVAPALSAQATTHTLPTRVLKLEFEEQLPEAYQPATVKAAVGDFGDWLATRYPGADAKFLGTDCSTPPCMIGLSFSDKGFSGAADLRGFYGDVRSELERRAGWPMAAVHADQDSNGRQYLWMYGIPGESGVELAQDLRDNAEQRHAARMDPLRAPTEPAIPGKGEAGYAGD